jgi:hypothetical protein
MSKDQVWIRQTQLSDEQTVRVAELVAEARTRLSEALQLLRSAVGDETLRPTEKLAVLVDASDGETLIATPAAGEGEEYTECLVFHGDQGACQVEVADSFTMGRPTAPPQELPQRLRAVSSH